MFLRHLLPAFLIAIAAITAAPPTDSTTTTMQTQPSVSKEIAARVELASKRHRRLFTWNIIWLFSGGLVTIWLSWRVWNAGNAEQSAMADASNERISIISSDLEKEKQKTESQRERAAESERKLLELQQLLEESRSVDRERAKEILEHGSKGSVDIVRVPHNQDAEDLASQIAAALIEYGWKVPSSVENVAGGYSRPGITLEVGAEGAETDQTPESLPEPASTLYRFLHESVKLNPSVRVIAYPNVSQNKLLISIGPKY